MDRKYKFPAAPVSRNHFHSPCPDCLFFHGFPASGTAAADIKTGAPQTFPNLRGACLVYQHIQLKGKYSQKEYRCFSYCRSVPRILSISYKKRFMLSVADDGSSLSETVKFTLCWAENASSASRNASALATSLTPVILYRPSMKTRVMS